MFAGLGILIFLFFGITLPSVISGELLTQREIIGQGGFLIMGIVLVLVPLGGRFDVGKDYVKSYLFGICRKIEYKNIVRWGAVSIGKGLAGWVKTKRGHKYFSFSERGFGKEAIMNAKRALESK